MKLKEMGFNFSLSHKVINDNIQVVRTLENQTDLLDFLLSKINEI